MTTHGETLSCLVLLTNLEAQTFVLTGMDIGQFPLTSTSSPQMAQLALSPSGPHSSLPQ